MAHSACVRGICCGGNAHLFCCHSPFPVVLLLLGESGGCFIKARRPAAIWLIFICIANNSLYPAPPSYVARLAFVRGNFCNPTSILFSFFTLPRIHPKRHHICVFFRSRLLQVMKESSDNYHASLDGLFSSSKLEVGRSSRERESSGGCERGERLDAY